MESKILSSTGFLHELSIEELYVLTTHWLSDIAFYEQEISYFQSLIVRYFLPNVEDDNVLVIESLKSHLESLDSRKEQLKNAIQEHQMQLSRLLHNAHAQEDPHFNVLHAKHEEKLSDFVRELRQMKLEFFNATKFSGKIKRPA